MAKLERGKGRRKEVIEIIQRGVVLEQRQTAGDDRRLPGFRRCPSAAAASAALAHEVQSLLRDGMRPADDEARALAAASKPAPDPKAASSLRRDLGLYNEATGFVVTSRRMAGKSLDEGSAAWKKAVAKGDLLPMSLVQDDPIIVRVVLGDPLSQDEEAAWIGRVDAHLDLRDGKLCITGGAVFSQEEYDADDPHLEQYVVELPVPKGRYRAALFTLARGINGPVAHERATTDDEPVDFVLHLTPIDAAPKSGLSALPDDGWFDGGANARTLERPSPGLPAVDVLRRLDREAGDWLFVREAFPDLTGHSLAPLRGGPLDVGPEALVHAARLAWLAAPYTVIELRLRAAEASPSLDAAWLAGAVAFHQDGVVRVLFSADATLLELLPMLERLGPWIAGLPEGSLLDLCAAARHPANDQPIDAGRLWLRGTLVAGRWRISGALPRVDRATLELGLSFAADSARGEGLDQARATFRERFAEVWPSASSSDTTDEGADGWDDDADDDDDGGWSFQRPIVGAKIYTSPSGRVWSQTMALLLSEQIDTKTKEIERDLRLAGYRHVGDLVCDACDTVGLRGYGRQEADAWAVTRATSPDQVELEIVTRFGDGTSLLTSAAADRRTPPLPHQLHQQLPGAPPADLIARHHERITELREPHGQPSAIAPKLQPLAELLDGVLFPPS